ncbi:hypothetical protein F4779DRAFT_471694 [Xylariaceae sp. FL0662B]|nr:hypothetical protein F4779DRAFT_471694 [Xylariaceae sp. FL0662B]
MTYSITSSGFLKETCTWLIRSKEVLLALGAVAMVVLSALSVHVHSLSCADALLPTSTEPVHPVCPLRIPVTGLFFLHTSCWCSHDPIFGTMCIDGLWFVIQAMPMVWARLGRRSSSMVA